MLYKFRVSDQSGKIFEQALDADSSNEARAKLKNRRLIVLQELTSGAGEAQRALLPLRRKFDYLNFTENLAPLLEAEIPLERSLRIIEDGAAKAEFAAEVAAMRLALHEGKKFSDIVESSRNFPKIFPNLIRAGEETGCLSKVMQELYRFSSESKKFRDFLITSSIYPVLIMAVTFIVVVVLFLFLIPKFADTFMQTGRQPPLPTQLLIELSGMLRSYWFVLPLLGAGIIAFIHNVRSGGACKKYFDRAVLKIPLLKEIVIENEMCRFISTLAILIESHVHLLSSVKIAVNTLNNSLVTESLDKVAEELRSGKKLSETLCRSEYVPKNTIQMLKVGEESAEVGKMLGRCARQLERNITNRIKRLIAIYEPAVIIFLALVVLLVVVSILLAIMEMNQL